MKMPSLAHLALLLSLFQGVLSETPPGKDAIKLSNVQTLTLHAHRMTWYRRVSPIEQLKCVGPPRVCDLYEIDTMRCTNQGYDYDEEDIQWSCTASLPSEFKLGSTDVICEGYRNAEDKWILKGSCGVEYRLLLTEKGEQRYGHYKQSSKKTDTDNDSVAGTIFFIVFIGFLLFIVYSACWRNRGNQPRRSRRGGGGGGGGGDDPPPPYEYQPTSSQYKRSDSGPGFWTGAAAGTAAGSAAGYTMGRMHNRQQAERETRAGSSSYTRYYDQDRDEPRSVRNSSPTRVNTGFGSTRRR